MADPPPPPIGNVFPLLLYLLFIALVVAFIVWLLRPLFLQNASSSDRLEDEAIRELLSEIKKLREEIAELRRELED